jgi:hypothetical protein
MHAAAVTRAAGLLPDAVLETMEVPVKRDAVSRAIREELFGDAA